MKTKSGLILVSALSSALLSQSALASCGSKYEEYVARLQPRVDAAIDVHTKSQELIFIDGVAGVIGAAVTTMASPEAASSGQTIIATGGVAGVYAGYLSAEAIWGPDRLKELNDRLKDAKFTLQALREAYIGDGEAIEELAKIVSEQVKRADPARVAKAVIDLDSADAFCSTGDILDSSRAIIDKVAGKLK